jgi:hypothetical protein
VSIRFEKKGEMDILKIVMSVLMARQIYRMFKLNFHLKDSKHRKMHIVGED